MRNLLTCALSVFLILPVFSQDWPGSSNTLLDLSVQSSTEIIDRLDPYEPVTEREKSLYRRYQDTLNARLVQFALTPLNTLLKEDNISLAPTDALAEYLTYSKDGLPNILMPKRAIKKVGNNGYTTDYFFSFKLIVKAHGAIAGLSERVKPKVQCRIRVFDPSGEEVRDVESEILSSAFVKSSEFPQLSFDKIGLDHIEMLQHRLEPLVIEALKEAIGKLD